MSTHDRELIDRYLVGQLSGDELTAVEARIVMDPAFRREFEITEALRAGLARLDDSDGIESLLADPASSMRRLSLVDRARAVWSHPGYVLAASVAAIGLGVLALLLYGQLENQRRLIVALYESAAVATLAPAQGQAVLSFASLRSASGPVKVQVPSEPVQYEMAFDVGAEPAARYSVAIIKPTTVGDVVILEVPHVAPGADGLVRLSIHSAVLAPGDYLVVLDSGQTDGPADVDGSRVIVSYPLQVRR